jgi:hypothetical protein
MHFFINRLKYKSVSVDPVDASRLFRNVEQGQDTVFSQLIELPHSTSACLKSNKKVPWQGIQRIS